MINPGPTFGGPAQKSHRRSPAKAGLVLAVMVGALGVAGCGHDSARGTPPPLSVPASPESGVKTVVSDLQLEIKSVGYDPGQVTGTFTGATQRALTAFQKAVGVSSIEDGTLGPQTATSLQSRLGGTSRAVRALQNALAEVGLFHGTANGVYGSETFAAVQALQRLTHLRVDGLFGPASAVGLGVLYRGHQGGPPTPSTTAKKVAGIAGSAFRPEEQTT